MNTSLESLILEVQKLEVGFTMNELGELLNRTNFQSMDIGHFIPPPSEGYSRNILLMRPLEIVVLRWPAHTQSAVHCHEGFWGYVAVVEGALDNFTYTFKDGIIKDSKSARGLKGALVPEEDGVIHKLCNRTEEEAISIHFYYPPLENLANMQVFDLDQGRIGILNEKAQTSSWNEPASHFKEIREGAFFYKCRKASHYIHLVIPKPSTAIVNEMTRKYFKEQARMYDDFDRRDRKRLLYTEKVNQIVAETINRNNSKKLLMIACGTGRRSVEIRDQVQHPIEIFGIDASESMLMEAETRNIETIHGTWPNVKTTEKFDLITCLYAFGHISSKEERIRSLSAMFDALNPSGSIMIDVFNVNDENEWGPEVVRLFEDLGLHSYGYEKGDVFYSRSGGMEIAFLHFSDEHELCEEIEQVGFHISSVQHIGYVVSTGQILDHKHGNLLITAEKRSSVP